ncbi:MAG: polysaccharide deacetylase family protein [Longicatena sp.]
MSKRRRKRRVNFKHLAILIVCAVGLIACLFGGYKVFAHVFAPDKLNTYNKETKKIGDMEHFTENNDQYKLSFYYPTFKDESALNDCVAAYKKKNIKTSLKQTEQYNIHIDYDAETIYDYITLTFHQTLSDKDNKIIQSEDVSYNYDKTTKKIMNVSNVLRRDYPTLLRTLAKTSKIDEKLITKKNLNNFILRNEAVTFYFNNDIKQAIEVPYEKNKAYIALQNKGIPSLYQAKAPTPDDMKIDPSKPMIAITFDDGPNAKNTNIIMDEFEKYDGRATFFILGQNVKNQGVDNSSIIKDMYARGFELANHSWDHSMRIAANTSNFMNESEVAKEIYDTQDVIYSAAGSEPVYFRPPYGALNDNVRKVSTLDFALWNVDTLDWKSKNADAITTIAKTKAGDGAVILLHDIYDSSAKAIQQMLPILKEKGYQFVTLSELMKYKGEDLIAEDAVILSPFNK